MYMVIDVSLMFDKKTQQTEKQEDGEEDDALIGCGGECGVCGDTFKMQN